MPRRPDREPIEGRLVDDSPQPEYYVPQMTWWRRTLLWLLETERGQVAIFVFALLTSAIAYNYVGWALAALYLGFLGGFLVGYWIAQKHFEMSGEVPPL